MPNSDSAPEPASVTPEPAGVRIENILKVGSMVGGQVIGTSIGQMTVQRDLIIIQTFQYIHERPDRGGGGAARGVYVASFVEPAGK